MYSLTYLEITSSLVSGGKGESKTIYFDVPEGQSVAGWTASLAWEVKHSTSQGTFYDDEQVSHRYTDTPLYTILPIYGASL